MGIRMMIKKIVSKRHIAIIVSIVLILGSISSTQTNAATYIPSSTICEKLGILQGTGDGVTEAYLEKSTTRLQAAILFLRVKGLEEEALSYTYTESFVDGNDVSWGGGRAILAYLYAHPELGWIGDLHGAFRPNEIITVQAFYKVILETLGYKQGVDFYWSGVVNFAILKGMGNARYHTTVTNNLFAIMIVELLRSDTKDFVLFAQLLSDQDLIDTDMAVGLGLITYPENQYYEIKFEFSDPDHILRADGISQTRVTAIITKKSDGSTVDIDGEMTFQVTAGTLNIDSVYIVAGQATVYLNSVASNQAIIANLSVKITDAGTYTEFLHLTGNVDIVFDPNELPD